MPAVSAGVEDIDTHNKDLLVVNLLPVSPPWTGHLGDHLPSYFWTLLDLVNQSPTDACEFLESLIKFDKILKA